jgi:hypothetical protein
VKAAEPVIDEATSVVVGTSTLPLLRAMPLPVPGQEVVDLLGGMIMQTREHVGEPSLWVHVVELCGLDQRIDRSDAAAALVRAGEGPVLTPHCDRPDLSLGRIVGHADAAVVEEACERLFLQTSNRFNRESSPNWDFR